MKRKATDLEHKKPAEPTEPGPALSAIGPGLEADYRTAPDFSDLTVECGDKTCLRYFRSSIVRVDFFRTALAEQRALTPATCERISVLEIPHPSPIVNDFFNWIDMLRSPGRPSWLQSKDLAALVGLGRLGFQYAPTTLLPECIAAIRLRPDTPREQIEDVVRFATESGTALRALVANSAHSFKPTGLPGGWPREIWEALLEQKAPTARERLSQMAITIWADIAPSRALRREVLADLKKRLLHSQKPTNAVVEYWTVLSSSATQAQRTWLLEVAYGLMADIAKEMTSADSFI